jgi:hypothetical protein
VGTPPTFVTVDGVWGSVGYIWQHLDRDQVDTPELCSNTHEFGISTWTEQNRIPRWHDIPHMWPLRAQTLVDESEIILIL